MNTPNEIPNDSSNPILDIVNSIQSKLNENTQEEQTIQNTNNPDFNNLDISKIIGMLNPNKTTTANSTSTPLSSLGSLDLSSIMNFQNILSGMSTPDPRQNLLSSLKPFLRENRQKNIDTYISLLGVMKAFNIFNGKDRD